MSSEIAGRGDVDRATGEAGSAGARGTSAPWRLSGWDRFWFSPAQSMPLARIRGWLALLAAMLFLSHWSDMPFWFGSEGVLAPEVFGRIVQGTESVAEARGRLSPLFLTTSPLLLRGYLVLGIALAVLVAVGRGGRIASVALWLAVVGLANRSAMLAGLAELPLAFGLGYLAIAPAGSPLSGPAVARHWTAGFSRRLLQVHVSLWIATMVATQLAGLVWWNGQAALAIVGPVSERLWELSDLFARPLLGATVTHLLILTPMVALPLAWIRPTARAATWVLIGWTAVWALLSAELLYGAALAGVMASLLPVDESIAAGGPQHGEQRHR